MGEAVVTCAMMEDHTSKHEPLDSGLLEVAPIQLPSI